MRGLNSIELHQRARAQRTAAMAVLIGRLWQRLFLRAPAVPSVMARER